MDHALRAPAQTAAVPTPVRSLPKPETTRPGSAPTSERQPLRKLSPGHRTIQSWGTSAHGPVDVLPRGMEFQAVQACDLPVRGTGGVTQDPWDLLG